MSEQHQVTVESLVDFPKDVGKAFLGRDWRAMALDSRHLSALTHFGHHLPSQTVSNDKISDRNRLQYFTLEFLIRHLLLQAYEHPVEGFDEIPKAFVEMMEGVSQGKVIVRM